MESRRTIGAVAVLVVLACAGWLVYYIHSQPAVGESIAFRRPAACATCGAAYVAEFGDSPASCSRCGARALFPAVKCTKCGAILPARPALGARSDPKCPRCGGSGRTEVGPDDVH